VDAHTIDHGAGPPLLLLHGNPDTAELWRGVIERLPDRRCVAPDLPGYGGTPPTPGAIDLAEVAAWVEALRVDRKLDGPLDLAVHDAGAFYGLAWAVQHPDLVRRIVVTNAFFHRDYCWHFWGRVWRTPVLGELSMHLFFWPTFVAEMRRGSRKLTTEQLRAMWARITPATKKNALRLYRAMTPALLAGWDDRMLALAARVPVMVVWGDRDPYIPRSFAERFGAREVHHLADVGHFVPSEAPAELAERMRAFLAA
jgi:pimeloyl-ACP methyl ester carboxylesterase